MYVRSKQKVQDEVGPLEYIDGNVVTEGFLMAENLNEFISSVLTREYITSLPVYLFRTTNCNANNGGKENKGYEG